MHDKRFNHGIERLREPERLARLEVDRVVALVRQGLSENASILEIGVGSGVFAEKFAAAGFKIAGIDVNPEMVAAAKSFVPGGIFNQAPAEKIPYPDQNFDLVFMGLVLHETDDPLAAMKEAYRVVKSRLCILEWPAQEQPFGPPAGDRIGEERIKSLALEAGFCKFETINLKELVFYVLTKPEK